MNKSRRFAKMVAAGNDFVAVDARGRADLLARGGDLARLLCPRRFSVGADGLLLLAPPRGAGDDFAMAYFNADGSEGAMCGNGARSLVRFAKTVGAFQGDAARFATAAGPCEALLLPDGRVSLGMPDGQVIAADLEVADRDGQPWRGAWVDTGVPHFVAWMSPRAGAEELEAVDVARAGRSLRRHPVFGEAGANVNFALPLDDERHPAVAVRVYERGVEAETLGCGSGAVASAVATLGRKGLASGRVFVATRSGENLEVEASVAPDGKVSGARLTGSATLVYWGEYEADWLQPV